MKNRSFIGRCGFALNGIREALRREQSFRIQVGAAALVIMLLLVLRPAPIWWGLFLLVIGAVLAFELLNTALEALMDRLHPEKHDSIRVAKDCAAGAVLVMSFVSVLLFALFLWERYF
jgi:undecaprenol kinase